MNQLSRTSTALTCIVTSITSILLFAYGSGLGGWHGVLPTVLAGIYTMSSLSVIISLFKADK